MPGRRVPRPRKPAPDADAPGATPVVPSGPADIRPIPHGRAHCSSRSGRPLHSSSLSMEQVQGAERARAHGSMQCPRAGRVQSRRERCVGHAVSRGRSRHRDRVSCAGRDGPRAAPRLRGLRAAGASVDSCVSGTSPVEAGHGQPKQALALLRSMQQAAAASAGCGQGTGDGSRAVRDDRASSAEDHGAVLVWRLRPMLRRPSISSEAAR